MVLKNAYNLYEGLQKLGITNLRQQQEAPMQAIFDGKDAIVLMPTAGGKSLLYQLPAVMDDTGKLTLVISPLKALQLDQVDALRSKGIRAAVLNSDLSAAEHRDVLEDMTKRGGLLYLAPEQLRSPAVAEALQSCPILTRIAVDEAHILPQAKDDFRKAYGKIGSFIDSLPRHPQVIALTATATRKDVDRIRKSLNIDNASLFRTPMRRDNLRLYIKRIEAGGKTRKGGQSIEHTLFQSVERELSKWDKDGTVIIYCPTVKLVKRLCKWLKARDYPVGKYHGKMKHAKRKAAQATFMSGKKPIMVATNAFDLGIDKPDVRLVIHAGLPLSMDGYVQEIGRAGRDGKKSRCMLFFTKADFERNKRILSHSGGNKAIRRKLKRLNALHGLVDSKKCLWRVIEKYFGEKPQKKCEKCCRCRQKSV